MSGCHQPEKRPKRQNEFRLFPASEEHSKVNKMVLGQSRCATLKKAETNTLWKAISWWGVNTATSVFISMDHELKE